MLGLLFWGLHRGRLARLAHANKGLTRLMEKIAPLIWCRKELLGISPTAAYRAFADTDRFNRLRGADPLVIEERSLPSGQVERRIRVGAGNEYVEEPFDWEEGQRYSVLRRYDEGMLAAYRWSVSFEESPGGTLVHVEALLYPRKAWMRILLWAYTRFVLQREVIVLFRAVRAALVSKGKDDFVLPVPEIERSRVNEARLAAAHKTLIDDQISEPVVESLLNLLREETDLELLHLRPLVLAQRLELDREQSVAAFLHGTRRGIFELRWSLLCPLCRGAKGEEEDLSRIKLEGHCDSCNINFDADFERSVQVTFRPSPALRPLAANYFCVGGPQRTPHIRAQRRIEAGGEARLCELWPVDLNEPSLRCPERKLKLLISGPGRYRFDGESFVRTGDHVGLTIENTSDQALHFLVEDLQYPNDILTASMVIQNDIFRDLFSSQTLSPDAVLVLRPLAFLFTDLTGSTAMYEVDGDAASFAKVKAHFDILLAVLAEHNGSLVKTIGDAVMATFDDPADGMRCAIAMQQRMKAESDLVIKIGLHYGRAMAVTLNDRLDYFGGTVNRSARLEGQSRSGDIVCSKAVYEDPAVAELLAKSAFDLSHEEAQVKGVEEPMKVLRIQVVCYE
jgi:class 3 adenylate cyclase